MTIKLKVRQWDDNALKKRDEVYMALQVDEGAWGW
jgi:hypothetical protein